MRPIVLGALCCASILAAAPAGATTIGIGAFGGAEVPIVQEDAGSGAVYGIRVPISLMSFLSIEPYWSGASLSEADFESQGFTYERDGFDHDVFGAHFILGSLAVSDGFGFYPYVGIGSHTLKRTGSEDIQDVGFDFGVGVGLAILRKVRLDLRGEMNMIVTGDTSRKFGTLSIGASYGLWSKP
jgi:hypothetical protein